MPVRFSRYAWPIIGLAAIALSFRLLYRDLSGLSLEDLAESLAVISFEHWLLSAAAAAIAYATLAAYDHLALRHLGKRVPLLFVSFCSFTTYAFSHTLGASIFSGAVIRYRAYTSQGLSGGDVALLVAFCSLTFTLGVAILSAIVLICAPDIAERFIGMLWLDASQTAGFLLLGLVAIYFAGSFLGVRSLNLGRLHLSYPRPPIAIGQILIGPIELVGAAAVIYFALPATGNPGFLIVLGIFLLSFSAALLSNAPGGLGVLELVFITGLSEMNPADVLAALLVFRLFYLLVPFLISVLVIVIFERTQFSAKHRRIDIDEAPGEPGRVGK